MGPASKGPPRPQLPVRGLLSSRTKFAAGAVQTPTTILFSSTLFRVSRYALCWLSSKASWLAWSSTVPNVAALTVKPKGCLVGHQRLHLVAPRKVAPIPPRRGAGHMVVVAVSNRPALVCPAFRKWRTPAVVRVTLRTRPARLPRVRAPRVLPRLPPRLPPRHRRGVRVGGVQKWETDKGTCRRL